MEKQGCLSLDELTMFNESENCNNLKTFLIFHGWFEGPQNAAHMTGSLKLTCVYFIGYDASQTPSLCLSAIHTILRQLNNCAFRDDLPHA